MITTIRNFRDVVTATILVRKAERLAAQTERRHARARERDAADRVRFQSLLAKAKRIVAEHLEDGV